MVCGRVPNLWFLTNVAAIARPDTLARAIQRLHLHSDRFCSRGMVCGRVPNLWFLTNAAAAARPDTLARAIQRLRKSWTGVVA